MTLEELQAKIEALEDEKESLVAKNKELLSEKRKIKAKYEDIDPEQFNKILDENESLKKSLEKLDKEQNGMYIYNLGTGHGVSVLDMVKGFEKATGKAETTGGTGTELSEPPV